MKKAIIGLSGLIVLTFFIIIAVNAQNNDQQNMKLNSGTTQDISQTLSPGLCCSLSGSKTTACNSTNCSVVKCDASKCKEGKCDPTTCNSGKCDPANCNGGKYDQTTCKTNCKSASTGMRSSPMNCNR